MIPKLHFIIPFYCSDFAMEVRYYPNRDRQSTLAPQILWRIPIELSDRILANWGIESQSIRDRDPRFHRVFLE